MSYPFLLERNACSAWFRAAEPQAADKFRSLRFAVDISGKAKSRNWTLGKLGQFLSAVCCPHAAQMLDGFDDYTHANGAFFNDWAPVPLLPIRSKGYLKAFNALAVANFGEPRAKHA